MSTYEDDHNTGSSSETPARGQHHTTLNDVFQQFFENPAHAAAPLPNLDTPTGANSAEQTVGALMNALRSLGDQAEGAGALPAQLATELQAMINDPSALIPGKHRGVSEEFLDSLDRVDRRRLKRDETCPICTSEFLSDEYPLVVTLNRCRHRFDLDCIKPWLSVNSTCPLCRADVLEKKKIELPSDDEEEFDDMYG